MRALRTLLLASSLITLSLAGCGGGDQPPDDDAGTGGGDDTGVPGHDAGTPGNDTGTPGDDTGAPGDDAAVVGDDTGSSGGCGSGPACDAPFTCSASGICVSASGIPAFDHVYVAIFENRSLDTVLGHAPYFDGLVASYASASDYVSIGHPSLPNYIAMTSGDTYGDMCDCDPGATHDCNSFTCTAIGGFCTCEHDAMHLADQLEAAGLTWREYGEGMGEPCHSADVTASHFAVRHLPFMYYANVLSDTTRCTDHVRDFGDFPADLGSYRFTMISPNLCSDMHDTCGGNAVTHGNDWASTNLQPIVDALGAYDVLFIVWDEEDNSVGNAPIPFIVVSPLVTPGVVTAAHYDHYSLLATWEDGLGLTRLGNAASATPIADIWR
jgi:hypothetical protein